MSNPRTFITLFGQRVFVDVIQLRTFFFQLRTLRGDHPELGLKSNDKCPCKTHRIDGRGGGRVTTGARDWSDVAHSHQKLDPKQITSFLWASLTLLSK